MLQYFVITLIAILLCLIPNSKKNRRKKWFLPLSFMVITVFLAIRYNYGLDYPSYLELFSRGATSTSYRGDSEVLFYRMMHLFPHFYQFVIAYTVLIMGMLFLMVRKYCNEKYYAFFIIMFMLMPAMCLNLMSAMRSSMAACVIWLGIYLFYLKQKRWILYMMIIVVASGFHLSALVFLLLPLLDILVNRVSGRGLLYVLVACLVLSFIGTSFLYEWMFGSTTVFGGYANTYEDLAQANNRTIFGVLNNSLMLFPAYYICQSKEAFLKQNRGLYVLAMTYLLIFMLNMDLQGRFTSYLCVFFILSITMVAGGFPKGGSFEQHSVLSFNQKLVMLLPLMVNIAYNFYSFIISLSSGSYIWEEGNPLIYQTIFDAPYLP